MSNVVSNTQTANTTVANKSGNAFTRFFRGFGASIVNARAISALNELSDRQLEDLGIARENIARHVMDMNK